jgi:hypothetical protein
MSSLVLLGYGQIAQQRAYRRGASTWNIKEKVSGF